MSTRCSQSSTPENGSYFRRLRAMPRRIWETSFEVIPAGPSLRPRWATLTYRLLFFLALSGLAFFLGPILAGLRVCCPPRPVSRLWEDVQHMWKLDPVLATRKVERIWQQLRLTPRTGCEVLPYGKFHSATHRFYLDDLLFRCKFSLGRYRDALAIAEEHLQILIAPHAVIWKADCLERLGDRWGAIRFLEANHGIHDPRAQIEGKLKEFKLGLSS